MDAGDWTWKYIYANLVLFQYACYPTLKVLSGIQWCAVRLSSQSTIVSGYGLRNAPRCRSNNTPVRGQALTIRPSLSTLDSTKHTFRWADVVKGESQSSVSVFSSSQCLMQCLFPLGEQVHTTPFVYYTTAFTIRCLWQPAHSWFMQPVHYTWKTFVAPQNKSQPKWRVPPVRKSDWIELAFCGSKALQVNREAFSWLWNKEKLVPSFWDVFKLKTQPKWEEKC